MSIYGDIPDKRSDWGVLTFLLDIHRDTPAPVYYDPHHFEAMMLAAAQHQQQQQQMAGASNYDSGVNQAELLMTPSKMMTAAAGAAASIGKKKRGGKKSPSSKVILWSMTIWLSSPGSRLSLCSLLLTSLLFPYHRALAEVVADGPKKKIKGFVQL